MRAWWIMTCIIAAFFSGAFAQAMFTPVNASIGVPLVNETNSNTSPKQLPGSTLVGMLTEGISSERISPGDWVKESQIHVYNDRVVINIDDPEWAYFTDTNSMDPVIDATSHAIEIVPSSPSQVNIGDIASYKDGEDTIIHRVIGKGKDDKGEFFIFKGDNNPTKDPGKVRFEQIQRIVVAIIY
jgi:hypothetical protein